LTILNLDSNKTLQIEQKEAKLDFVNGLIRLSLELPARKEKCEFTIKLLNENVGNLTDYIKNEDKSVEKVLVYNNGNFFKEYTKINQSSIHKIIS
jgi:hypothetical protein